MSQAIEYQQELETPSLLGLVSAFWGLGGVVFLLGSAAYRLCPHFVTSFASEYSWYHWAFLPLFCAFMIYYEGIKGFQKSFSPRVAARARYLSTNPDLVKTIFAPLFCMGYFHATKRRMIASFILTFVIVGLVVLTGQLSQPWRGIVDAGVVLGLVWGSGATLIYGIQAFVRPEFAVDPELPK